MTEAEVLACEKITPTIAGKFLHKDPQTIRYWLQDKIVDIGFAYKREGCQRWMYYISAEKLVNLKTGGGVTG